MVKVQFFPRITPDQDFQMGVFLLMLGKNQTLYIHREELIQLSRVCSQTVLFQPCIRRSFFLVTEVDWRQARQVESAAPARARGHPQHEQRQQQQPRPPRWSRRVHDGRCEGRAAERGG